MTEQQEQPASKKRVIEEVKVRHQGSNKAFTVAEDADPVLQRLCWHAWMVNYKWSFTLCDTHHVFPAQWARANWKCNPFTRAFDKDQTADADILTKSWKVLMRALVNQSAGMHYGCYELQILAECARQIYNHDPQYRGEYEYEKLLEFAREELKKAKIGTTSVDKEAAGIWDRLLYHWDRNMSFYRYPYAFNLDRLGQPGDDQAAHPRLRYEGFRGHQDIYYDF
jgi:hypothetical protein